MPTCEDTVRAAGLQAILDLFDPSGASAAYFQVRTAAASAIVTLGFASPTAFASAAGGGVSSAAAISDGTAAITGTADDVAWFSQDNTLQMVCTIGTSGAEFTISSLAITAADVIKCTALTLTFPAA